MSELSDEWRDKPLNEVAAAAIENTMQAHVRAGIELQRRTIEESARTGQRLIVATWVLVALTVVLVAITILQLVGVLD